jgi:transposase
MKKNTIALRGQKAISQRAKKSIRKSSHGRLTAGLDLGDRTSRYCILDEAGEVASEGSVATTKTGLSAVFGNIPPMRIALEVGTHSPWVSRHLAALGHEVIVANTHKLKLITQSTRKNDRNDAERLARLARVDPKLLSPIRHRGAQAQADLAVIRARAAMVKARTELINAARGLVKPMGERLRKCDAGQVDANLGADLSPATLAVVQPILEAIDTITEKIRVYDEQIGKIAKRYPELTLLTQVYGVGILIGLTYMLTIEDPQRFAHSRDVGPFLGLQPKQRDSGQSQPQLGISKTGDRLLRSLLVQGAHCILRKNAPDSDLRRWGLKKAEGSKRAKRRALVGMARKLAVLLHRLWVTSEVYEPLHQQAGAKKIAA